MDQVNFHDMQCSIFFLNIVHCFLKLIFYPHNGFIQSIKLHHLCSYVCKSPRKQLKTSVGTKIYRTVNSNFLVHVTLLFIVNKLQSQIHHVHCFFLQRLPNQ